MKHGSVRSAAWKPISVGGPSIRNSASARSIRRRAVSRVVSWTISLAIIGSYRPEISSPARTPESTRTPGPDGSS